MASPHSSLISRCQFLTYQTHDSSASTLVLRILCICPSSLPTKLRARAWTTGATRHRDPSRPHSPATLHLAHPSGLSLDLLHSIHDLPLGLVNFYSRIPNRLFSLASWTFALLAAHVPIIDKSAFLYKLSHCVCAVTRKEEVIPGLDAPCKAHKDQPERRGSDKHASLKILRHARKEQR